MANLASFKTPSISNEPNRHYAKGSSERQGLVAAVETFRSKTPLHVPLSVGGKEIQGVSPLIQKDPANHSKSVASYSNASHDHVAQAIDAALSAKPSWEATPFADRAAIFLKAADLVSGKYRYEILAATMIGQGKNAWQAEIDAAAELCDFFRNVITLCLGSSPSMLILSRFAVHFAEQLYAQQPAFNPIGIWNRVEYRPLEGFVYAITPFNFTAIAGNLPGAPALMGNVAIWKPSPSAIASNWLVYNVLLEAGLPPNVIQFVPGDAETVTKAVLSHPKFSALHYTGSTAVFRSLYGKIATGVADGTYEGYPRIVGETGGKNYHLLHHSATVSNAAINTVRGAFEYQGQKCSACSRAYVPSSLWGPFAKQLVEETKKLKIGDCADFGNFIGPVIHAGAFDRLKKAIDDAKSDKELELLVGGTYDGNTGYFIHPTIYRTTNPKHPLMSRELFGPILCIYVYDDLSHETSPTAKAKSDEAFTSICKTVDSTTSYALTGAVFAQDRAAIRHAEELLRNSAGNFYVNCKSTGSIVGQQPFGGARGSGTNDKAGSANLLSRFVSMRSVKEQFFEDPKVEYVSNET